MLVFIEKFEKSSLNYPLLTVLSGALEIADLDIFQTINICLEVIVISNQFTDYPDSAKIFHSQSSKKSISWR